MCESKEKCDCSTFRCLWDRHRNIHLDLSFELKKKYQSHKQKAVGIGLSQRIRSLLCEERLKSGHRERMLCSSDPRKNGHTDSRVVSETMDV